VKAAVKVLDSYSLISNIVAEAGKAAMFDVFRSARDWGRHCLHSVVNWVKCTIKSVSATPSVSHLFRPHLCYYLLDHPIRPHQHVGRNRQADLLGGFEVDSEFKFHRLLHRNVSGLSSF